MHIHTHLDIHIKPWTPQPSKDTAIPTTSSSPKTVAQPILTNSEALSYYSPHPCLHQSQTRTSTPRESLLF